MTDEDKWRVGHIVWRYLTVPDAERIARFWAEVVS
jgi:hypothetical protein